MNLRGVLSNWELFAGSPQAVPRLRELILQLAVQGQLVPQDPKDEPASELLKKIKVEKDRLVKEGKIKRDKPLAEIEEEEKPFELPRGWEWARLPEVTYNLGQGAPNDKFTYIDVAAIDNKLGVVDQVEIVEVADAPSRARKNVGVGTVLYSTVRPYLKNIAIVEKDYTPRAIASTAFAVMHPHAGLESKYLLHYLRSAVFTDFVSSKAVGVAYPAINDANFFEGVIALPPSAEQSRIVTRVQELMQLCDALEAKVTLEAQQHETLLRTLLATLTQSASSKDLGQNWQRVSDHFPLLLDRVEAIDALEQTILQLAVRGLLVPQNPTDEPASQLLKKIRAEKDKLILEGKIKRDKPLPPIAQDEQPFELPTGWEWARMESLASQITDGAHHTPTYVSEGVPFLSVKDLSSGYIDFSDTRFISHQAHQDLAKRCCPEMGDVLLTKIGTTGIAVVIDTPREFSLFVSVALIKLPAVSVDRDFLSMVINSPFVRQQSEDGTEGVGNKNLVLRKIKAFEIPVPPLPEQHRIVNRVTELRQLCAALRSRLAQSSQIQAQLAQALVKEFA